MTKLGSGTGSRTSLFLAGLVAGALLFAIAPVGAHHNDAKLKDRLSVLENKVQKLTKKTSALSASGNQYNGFVHARYVWANANWGCTNGENALWMADPEFEGDVMLGCPGTPSAAAAASRRSVLRR
ncbi:MAG: hypothetical protein M3198_05595 [Actinomycetota bacterium]|nr:hypothetical protein [Actinomycetota bacterium]